MYLGSSDTWTSKFKSNYFKSWIPNYTTTPCSLELQIMMQMSRSIIAKACTQAFAIRGLPMNSLNANMKVITQSLVIMTTVLIFSPNPMKLVLVLTRHPSNRAKHGWICLMTIWITDTWTFLAKETSLVDLSSKPTSMISKRANFGQEVAWQSHL